MGFVNSGGNQGFKIGSNCKTTGSIIIPNTVTSIGAYCFHGCSITDVEIPLTVTNIGDSAFHSCNSLTTVTIKSTNITFNGYSFWSTSTIVNFNTVNGFTPTGLNLTSGSNLSRASMLSMFNNLATGTGTIYLGSTNLAKMTTAEKAIATNKGWTLGT